MNKIAITTGDPNGIGAEITIKALNYLELQQAIQTELARRLQ